MIRAALVFAGLVCGSTAAAQTYERCTKVERGQFLAAVERAERLTLTATTAIGPNPSFERWFGRYNAKKGEIVRRNLKAIVKALRQDTLSAVCASNGEGLCAPDHFAFVDIDEAYVVHVCPAFFEMDTSHFSVVAQTEDFCYSRVECTDMAFGGPLDALLNADSYQYFVEDVTFFGVAGAPED